MKGQFVGILIVLAIGACREGGGQNHPEVQAVVERLYPLQKLPVVIDHAWLEKRTMHDSAGYAADSVLAPELATTLGLRRAWVDTAGGGSTPMFMAIDLPYTYIYPICRFRSPDGEKEFIVTEVNGPAGGHDAFYLLTAFPPDPADSIHAYVVAENHGDLGYSFEGYCRIEYPTITTSSLREERTPDGDSILYHSPGPTKTWSLDQ